MGVVTTPRKPTQCFGCPLYDARGPVWGSGEDVSSTTPVLVGEAPGPEECTKSVPFVGRAGSVLNIALSAAGIDRKDVYITNVCKCMPYVGTNKNRFRKPTRKEVEFCASRWLDQELRDLNPNITVALGDVASGYLSKGRVRGVTAWRGKVMDVDE